jgi:enamine deaminase RidA (YjgF/YER057c/UK114 family)
MSEDPRSDTPWRAINPPELAEPVGYANGVESQGGRRLCIAGQIDMAKDGTVANPGDLVAQVRGAFGNLCAVLRAAGGEPAHIVRMRIFVLDIADYKANGKAIGALYREHFGRWFPAMSLVQVAGLYDDGALIEVEAEAVIPDGA